MADTLTPFDELVWNHAVEGGLGSLADLVLAAGRDFGAQLTVQTVIADHGNPLVEVKPTGTPFEVRHVATVSLMRVEDPRGAFVFGAWPTDHPGVFHLIGTMPTTDRRWRSVEGWVANAAPAVVPVFLDHHDFADIATALSEFGTVEVSRMTARRRSDWSSLNRGWQARVGSSRPSPQEVIASTEAEGASVRTLSVHVAETLSLHLRRLAGATYYNGDWDIFEKFVLNRMALAAFRRRELLLGRYRQVDQPPPAPIEVRVPSHTFFDASATGEVLTELAGLRDIAMAVFHRNPYLHVVVTDHADGSNFDVFVTRHDAIEIHPGFRASVGSFTRLAQGLGERFGAVEIREVPEPEPLSLEDLISPS